MIYVQCVMYDECMYNEQCERRICVRCVLCVKLRVSRFGVFSLVRDARVVIPVRTIGPDGPSDVAGRGPGA